MWMCDPGIVTDYSKSNLGPSLFGSVDVLVVCIQSSPTAIYMYCF